MRIIKGMVLLGLFWASACRPLPPVNYAVLKSEGLRDSLQYQYYPKPKEPCSQVLVYLQDQQDSLNLWDSTVLSTLSKRYWVVSPGKSGFPDFFRQQSLDTKEGRAQDILAWLMHLQQQSYLHPEAQFFLLAESMEGEVGAYLSTLFAFRQIILIDVSATSRPLAYAEILDTRPKEKIAWKEILQRGIDTSLSGAQFLHELGTRPLAESYLGTHQNLFWQSYRQMPVLGELAHARGQYHWLYPFTYPIQAAKDTLLLQQADAVNPHTEMYFYTHEEKQVKPGLWLALQLEQLL